VGVVGPVEAVAREWDVRWQIALAQAQGPRRDFVLKRRELLRTNESGMLADGAWLNNEVAPDDASISLSWLSTLPALSHPKRDAHTWLCWLVARVSTLQERLNAARMDPVALDDERLVQVRLRRWAHRVTSDGVEGAFDRYLQLEGLDERAIRRAVSPAQLRAGAPVPGWAETLGEAVFEACYDGLPDVCDPMHPIPFESLLLPFVHIFLRRVRAGSCQRLTLMAEHRLARTLLASLTAMTRDALYVEFCRYRLAGFAPLAPFVYPEPDALYRRFVRQMQAGGLGALYEARPMLARWLAMKTDLYIAAVDEFVRRLEADLPALRRLWDNVDPGAVIDVRADLSDPHRGGRQVFSLTFANGRRLIYKPKDMGIDVAYNALLTWLNAAGAPVALRPLRVLDRHTHGWVECVDRAPCADRDAVTRYYQRAGALMCLVYALQGSDCHAENLIAAGEDPVLVDCETLLEPRPRAADHRGNDVRQRAALNRLMRDSVLTTGLLPSLGEEAERTFSIPGLCRYIILPIRIRTSRWRHINTDRMAVKSVATPRRAEHNLPHADGIPTDVVAYLEPLVSGFSAMYRFLMAQRPALLAVDGPLTAFRGRFVRFLFRMSILYATISAHARRLAVQADGVDHSLELELLARAFLVSEQIPAGWPILASEREALSRGDVPFFGSYTDQTALLLENGERIEDYCVMPSFDAMLTKLSNLNEQDLEFQVGLIRAAIAVYADLQAREAVATAAMQT
jgi:type 2 lantibiotic biosynthesis protein LanM